ncbi:hypothetical protein GWK47_047855 [Chionoecetes opilio]|uniref:Uncharacterized protein n=1 Tax=Chionoecetes opilio TaxID=41210 RepID=A0A8J4YDA0_CHIOP|nr:hypothetical protein GWK47_047855 [Chionoecetes opilio]
MFKGPGPADGICPANPNYGMTTFNSVAPNMKEEIFQRIVKEMKALIRQETEERDNSQDMEAMEEHEEVSADPFAELCDTTQADQEDDLEEDIKKELLGLEEEQGGNKTIQKYRDQWVTLFIKYNTGVPSSAAVERLFSTVGDVPEAKEGCLSEDNFEYLVFLKGNLPLLKQKFPKGPRRVDEEDEENNPAVGGGGGRGVVLGVSGAPSSEAHALPSRPRVVSVCSCELGKRVVMSRPTHNNNIQTHTAPGSSPGDFFSY